MLRLAPIAAALLLCAPALAEPGEGDSALSTLPSRTCTALDAVGVALTDNPDNPTDPVSGAAVWGCYFGAFASFSAAPVLPGVGTACGTAFGGLVGAVMEGRPIWPIILWTTPGILVGLLFSAAGIGISVAAAALAVSFASMLTGPVIALVSLAIFLFSAASLISGPLTLAGVIYAEDVSATPPSAESPPSESKVGALRAEPPPALRY